MPIESKIERPRKLTGLNIEYRLPDLATLRFSHVGFNRGNFGLVQLEIVELTGAGSRASRTLTTAHRHPAPFDLNDLAHQAAAMAEEPQLASVFNPVTLAALDQLQRGMNLNR